MDAVLSIDSNSASADAIVDIAKALASTGKFEQAVEFARSLNPDYEHKCAKAFIGILSAFANADEQRNAFLGRALNIACSIETARFRASVLARVACTLANTEQEKRAKDVFGQALEAARSADKEAHQAIALSDTASALGNVEENPLSNLMADEIYEEAITTANSEWSERDSALTHIARSLADAGRDERADEVFEEALETARSQELSRARDASLSSIANVLSSTGRCDLALEAAKSIDSRSSRNAALAKLSVVLSKSNEYEQASRVAHSIEDEAARNETLADVATALVDADQDRQPCTLFGQAIELACAIGDQSKRVRALATTVKIMAEGGNFDAASDLFGSLELDRSTWNDLLPAWRQALLEHTDEPRSLLRQSFAPYPFDAESAAKGVYSLVQAHVQAGAMDHAEAIARECPKLELDVLVQEPELPIPEGCDPDDLPVRQRAEYDTYVELYEEGTLDDAAFKSKAEELF